MELNNETEGESALEINIEALDKQIHDYWLENIYMSYALDCVDYGIIESIDALVKRPVSNAKLLTQRYRKYRESFLFNNLEEKEDLKWFEEAIREIKEMWMMVKSDGAKNENEGAKDSGKV